MGLLEQYRVFHKALHSDISVVEHEGVEYQIETSRGLRYIRDNDQVFAQQDPSQKTTLAMRARNERITRIIRTGKKWGWISDAEIADPLMSNN